MRTVNLEKLSPAFKSSSFVVLSSLNLSNTATLVFSAVTTLVIIPLVLDGIS